jgi:hypothetical protein
MRDMGYLCRRDLSLDISLQSDSNSALLDNAQNSAAIA